eukprot:5557165-Pyramimonas_sp.AAC.1
MADGLAGQALAPRAFRTWTSTPFPAMAASNTWANPSASTTRWRVNSTTSRGPRGPRPLRANRSRQASATRWRADSGFSIEQ